MSSPLTTTSSKGFLSNLMSSFLAIPVGILLFLASFWVLFKNEGRTNWSEVSAASTAVPADPASGTEGAFVSVTGSLGTSAPVGDAPFIQVGPYLQLQRSGEMYAWQQNESRQTRDKVGGGTETITTYTYEMVWTSSPASSSGFQDQTKQNPPAPAIVGTATQTASVGNVGSWTFAPASANLPSGSPLTLDATVLVPGVPGRPDGTYLYQGAGPAGAPQLGDVRLSWRAVRTGGNATIFGNVQGTSIVPHVHEGSSFLRVFTSTRDEALATMQTEYEIQGWLFRILGFLMMWFGMGMVFAPLHAIAGILPFLKKGTTFLVNVITFPIALVLTTITVVVSMILNSWVAILVTCLLFGGIIAALFVMRKKGGGAAAAPGPYTAHMGPPPGAPPGFGPPPGPPPGFGPPPGPPPGFGPPPGPPPM